jgi:Mg2+-importing ATPase
MNESPSAFWSVPATGMLGHFGVTAEGLGTAEAQRRLVQYGINLLKPETRSNAVSLLLGQFKSPIIVLLLFATGLSFFLHDPVNALIILAIVVASGLLGFWQEHSATRAVEKLLAMVQVRATVLRDGAPCDIPVEKIVPGDVVVLNTWDLVPGDCRIVESKDLFVDEATLTGETFPAEKSSGVLAADAPLAQRTNALWMGTHVVSGTANALVVVTGTRTEFGKVSERLKLRPEETEFERGIRRFGFFLMQVTLLLVMAIFAINLHLGRPVLESVLFSLALAVGLTPQLLPAIISINLARGEVIVKRLESIVSASLIVLVIRSRKPFVWSRPSKYLLLATLVTVAATVALPYTPLGPLFGFTQVPASFLLLIALIVALYVIATEIVKVVFYRTVKL